MRHVAVLHRGRRHAGARPCCALRAAGLLHGVTATSNPALTNALKIQQWRVSLGSPSERPAEASTASVTMLLSDAWVQLTRGSNGLAAAPWANWTRYTAFVESQVRNAKASGARIDYWDIQNEANQSPATVGTTELVYEQYRVAYNAIKRVDPAAKIVGPTFAHFWWVGGPKDSPVALDLPGFMAYAAAHNLTFDAMSWHELGIGSAGYYDQPRVAIDDLQIARVLLAQHPELGSPKLFINEYGPASNFVVPGNVGGFIDALELGNADQANTTCHEAASGPAYHGCSLGTLDSALLQDNQTPRGVYWVRAGYAGMTGTRVATGSNDPNVSAYATVDAVGSVSVMVSRHQGCSPSVNVYCNIPGAGPPAIPVAVMVRLPEAATVATITGMMIPTGTGAQAAPVAMAPMTVSTMTGVATIQLPALADGQVYFVTVTGGTGTVPPAVTQPSTTTSQPPVPTTVSPTMQLVQRLLGRRS